MKKIFLLVSIAVLVLGLSFSAQAATFTVTAVPLWTDTGITVTATDRLYFTSPAASWTWGGGVPLFGPGGDFHPSYAYDEWIPNGQHGEMIGYIGSAADLNAEPRQILQGDAGLFEIGASNVTITGLAGKLWLGFNDDYATDATSDNAGTGSVNVTTSPIPGSLLLLGSGILGMMGIGIRRKSS